MTDQCWYADEAAAYALGALDEQEAVSFERHLLTCEVCRAELDSFGAVREQLALAVPQFAAPRRLRRAVLAEVRPPRPARRLWRPGFAPAVGLAALVLAVAVVVDRVLVSSSARVRTVVASVHGAGHAVLRISGDHAELIVHGMPRPPGSDIYEVWIVRRRGTTPQPTNALFSVTSDGNGVVGVPGDVSAIGTVMVTEEPAGGTKVPTHPPVVRVRIA